MLRKVTRLAIAALFVGVLAAACSSPASTPPPAQVTKPSLAFNGATSSWDLPNGWRAIEINNRVWNIYDQNNKRVFQYQIELDGSLTLLEDDWVPTDY
ncbi:MAG: hypothetical protein HY681_11410 [Chloroflexi bacterium]|nr:hypothetical protein [Chloroflexota bacterium]